MNEKNDWINVDAETYLQLQADSKRLHEMETQLSTLLDMYPGGNGLLSTITLRKAMKK